MNNKGLMLIVFIVLVVLTVLNISGIGTRKEAKELKDQNKELRVENDSLISYIDLLLKENELIGAEIAKKDLIIKESEEIENNLIRAIINLDKSYKYEKDNPIHNNTNDKFKYIRSELLH